LNILEYLFSSSASAFRGIVLPAADVFQYIEPVHDLFHIGIIGKLGNRLQSLLFNRLHNDVLMLSLSMFRLYRSIFQGAMFGPMRAV
jgi:hypothetical protein